MTSISYKSEVILKSGVWLLKRKTIMPMKGFFFFLNVLCYLWKILTDCKIE